MSWDWNLEPPDDEAEIDETEKRMREEDAAEDQYFESQECREDLADLAEDAWLLSTEKS